MTIARSTQTARAPLAAEMRARRLFLLLAAGAAGMWALLALFPAAGHDQLWFLLMARRWLGGAALYGPEAFDSNPPMVVWLSAVPVWCGSLTHIPPTTWAKLLVSLLGAGCLLLSYSLLPYVWRRVRAWEQAALLFAAFVIFGAVPARDFGQREHLVSLLLLPYLLVAAARVSTCPLRVARLTAGLMAGVAVCLKPQQALVPVFVEAALLLAPDGILSTNGRSFAGTVGTSSPSGVSSAATRHPEHAVRWRLRLRHLLRPEPLLIVAVVGLYLTAITAFTPLYFQVALPITREVYWAVGHLSFVQLLKEAIELCALAGVCLAMLLHTGRASPVVRILLIGATASFAAYLLQGTGWYYQQLPSISFFSAALALQLLDVGTPSVSRVPAWLPVAAGALVLLSLALTAHFSGYPFTRDRAFAIDSPDPALFRELPAQTPVAMLTTSVDEAMMPVERYHLTWAQRTNNVWLLPAILRSERPEGISPRKHLTPEQVTSLDALQHRWMIEDLQRWRPTLVLVERCQDPAVRCQVLEDRHDDLLAWFLRDPAFRNAWTNYVFVRTDGRFDVYTPRTQ